jgi:hypothetical protein
MTHSYFKAGWRKTCLGLEPAWRKHYEALVLSRQYLRMSVEDSISKWRRRGDSNPRDPFGSNGFQDRRFQPLTHPSANDSNILCTLALLTCAGVTSFPPAARSSSSFI